MHPPFMLLPRPAVTEKALQAVRDFPLTVVIAPMGYGKSTLAGQLAEAHDHSFLYSVPAGPHDARFLWHDLCDNFEAQGLRGVAALRRLGFPETASQARKADELLRGLAPPVLLILDDYHHVTDQAMSDFWEQVARSAIPGLRLALLSRARPAMHLEELRIKGLATAFDQTLLAFSQEETAEYFDMHGISAAGAVNTAQKFSEGWPAALWLCLQSWLISGRMDLAPGLESLLANTVFAAYDAEERALLLRLSVLEHFTEEEAARLCEKPHLGARLRTLHERNAFLLFDARSGRYQFHSIFRDFLRKELAAATDLDKPSLYRQAGECCLARHDCIDALRLFSRAGRDEDLHRFLDTFLQEREHGDSAYFLEEKYAMAMAVPWEVRLANPLGYLAFVVTYTSIWPDSRTMFMLEEAEERISKAPNLPDYMKSRLRGEFEVIRGILAFNDYEAMNRHYCEADRLLNGPSVILSHDDLWNFGCPGLAYITLSKAGTYLEMLECMAQFWPCFVRLADEAGRGAERVVRAEYHLERGELELAAPLLWDVLPGLDGRRHVPTALTGGFCQARLHLASGDAAGVERALEAMRRRVESQDSEDHYESFELAAGYIYACLGRLRDIPQWLREGSVFDPPHCAIPQVFGFSYMVHGKALLLEGDFQRLAAVAAELPTCAAPLEHLMARIHGRMLTAIARWRLKGRVAALAPLREALDLCRPDGLVLPLAEYGGHGVGLFRHLARYEPGDALLEKVLFYAERVARISVYAGKKQTDGLLTPREREFMQHVAEGLSNAAIAARLGVAEVTVRKALGLTYAKLGVANRVEASRRFLDIYGEKKRA